MEEIGAKSPSDSVQQTSKSNLAAVPKSAEKGGTLDGEAIRISNTFLHQGNAGELLESPKVEKVPTKGILKKTSPKESTPIETVIPQKKEETKKTDIPTKDDVVHETKKTSANQANKLKPVNEPENEKQDTVNKKENNAANESRKAEFVRTGAPPTGDIINSARNNELDQKSQRKLTEIASGNKEDKVIKEAKSMNSAEITKSLQRSKPEVSLGSKIRDEPSSYSTSLKSHDVKQARDSEAKSALKTGNSTASQDSKVVKDTTTSKSKTSGENAKQANEPASRPPPSAASYIYQPKSERLGSRSEQSDTSANGSKSAAGQSRTTSSASGTIKDTSTSEGTASQSSSGTNHHTSNFYPAQPAIISKSTTTGAKVELKQAQQKMMVNTPLSPTSSRKDVSSKAKEETPQTYSHLSGRNIASDRAGPKVGDPSLKSDIANMDTQHSEKMKEIQTRHEEREKKQHLISPMSLTSSSVSTSSSAVASSTFVKSETTKVQAAAQGTVGGGQTRPDQDKTQSPVEGTRAGKPAVVASILNDVTSDLKKLDNEHSAQMKQIEDKFKEQDLKTRQPPSTDHHSARPANLGRSRFETGSAGPSSSRVVDAKVAADSLRTQFELDRHVPRRNETVHDTSNSIAKEPSLKPCNIKVQHLQYIFLD